ncbi:MAG: oligoendopeptidase F [Lachnospiraceae bacterium]|nr:oligoendopeptidase F [Lachnospiraceae bacterium]
MARELKKRSEAAREYTWATEDLYASDELWRADFEKAKTYLGVAEKYRGHLADSAEALYDYLKGADELDILLDSLSNYSSRKYDEDTTNAEYQAMNAQLMSFYSELLAAFSFVEPELVAVLEETYQKFFEEKPELKLYERELQRILRKKEHTLSAGEEKLLAAAGEMGRVPSDVFSIMNNADLRFPVVPDGEGGEIRLTHGNYIRLIENSDREVRRAAFEGLYSVYDQFKNTSAALLSGHVRKQVFYARQRKYGSAMEAALYWNEIPVEVYKNLIRTVHDNMGLMHRYMALRKKVLGVDELHMYDIHTPLVSGADKKIPFEEAKKIVYDALEPLGSEYRSHLKEGFENRWIDVYENEGKRSGAYSAGARKHPYVLLNYADNLDSVFTLAHEMGHALHSWYSNHTQPVIYSNYKIFVAEVASTCNEALMMQHLLKNTGDEKERAYLLNHAMDDFRTTLYRQTMFAEFEMMIHEMAERGEALTAEVLNKKYYELNRQYFGKDVTVDPQIALEWSRIPHFYYNFYVYQYATGYSAAMALSARILAEGESAVKDYIRFLSGGNSKDALSLLKLAGVDMSTPEPIEKALQVFAGYLDEMEKLAEK